MNGMDNVTAALTAARDAILATRRDLDAELKKVDAMIAIAKGEPKKKASPPKKQKPKKGGVRVSGESRQAVLAFVKTLDEPMLTTHIAQRIKGYSQPTISKALSSLAKEGSIRIAGYAPGKGRRPLYAPWPSSTKAPEADADLLDAIGVGERQGEAVEA